VWCHLLSKLSRAVCICPCTLTTKTFMNLKSYIYFIHSRFSVPQVLSCEGFLLPKKHTTKTMEHGGKLLHF
jgi:hypothetical protein